MIDLPNGMRCMIDRQATPEEVKESLKDVPPELVDRWKRKAKEWLKEQEEKEKNKKAE